MQLTYVYVFPMQLPAHDDASNTVDGQLPDPPRMDESQQLPGYFREEKSRLRFGAGFCT